MSTTKIPTRNYDWFHCTMEWRGKVFSVPELVSYSEKLPVVEYPIQAIYLGYPSLCDGTLLSFVEHVRRLRDCDISKPLIMAPDGYILDGRHRLVRLIIEGSDSVSVKRFPLDSDMPTPVSTTS